MYRIWTENDARYSFTDGLGGYYIYTDDPDRDPNVWFGHAYTSNIERLSPEIGGGWAFSKSRFDYEPEECQEPPEWTNPPSRIVLEQRREALSSPQNEQRNNSQGEQTMRISEDKLNEAEAMAKFVTFNYAKIRQLGLKEIINRYYNDPDHTPEEEESVDPVLQEKIEKISRTLDGNDYGCQEGRTRAIFGLMLTGDDKLFAKTSTGSSDGHTFNAGNTQYAFLCLTPLSNPNSHDYDVNRASMCRGNYRSSMLRARNIMRTGNTMCDCSIQGSDGVNFYRSAEEVEAQPQDSREENIRLSTEREIEDFFATIKLLADLNGEGYRVEDGFPLLTGAVGRTLRRFLPQLDNYKLPEEDTAESSNEEEA